MSETCKSCGRELTLDEMAIYKRMVNRAATEYLCMTCFAEEFHVEESLIHEKIKQFKKMGCILFSAS